MDNIRDQLEQEYCPPIDTALLYSILLDHDLQQDDQLQAARELLDSLKESAIIEDALGFDATGTSADPAAGGDDTHLAASSLGEATASASGSADQSSVSDELSALSLTQANHDDLEILDEETKISILVHVCDNRVTGSKAQFILRKCNGRIHAAMDEVLTHISFEDSFDAETGESVPYKGIDAFSEEHMSKRSRKGKLKRRSAKYSSGDLTALSSSSSPASPWTSTGDVKFLAKRVDMTEETTLSLYRNNNSCLPKTIEALIQATLKTPESAAHADAVSAVNAADLASEFPKLSSRHAQALIYLTRPSTAAAHELAKALSVQPVAGGLHIIPNYVPLLRPEDDALDALSPSARRAAMPRTAANMHLSATERASAYAADRDALHSQASTAYRKSKSDRLMSAAAAYYSQESHKREGARLAASAEAMDDRATVQSSASHVDLHGIDVLNGVRIARAGVEAWWAALGESRITGRVGAMEREAGYRVVVGRGTHSEGGRSKLGPAVRKMLSEGGWKFTDEGAAVLVRGRVRG